MSGVSYQFGEFCLDAERYQLLRNGQALRLEKKPFALLQLLVTSQGRLVTRAEIAEHLWGNEVFVDTEPGINTAVRKVRAALGETSEAPHFLQTVTGMGYRFLPVVAILDEASGKPEQEAPGKLEHVEEAEVMAPALSLAVTQPSARSWRPGWWTATGAGVLMILAALPPVLRVRSHLQAAAPPANTAGTRLSAPATAGIGVPESEIPEEAREQYRRGLYQYDRRDAMGSTVAFRRAIELAPQYALAYAGLAQALDAQAKFSDGVPGVFIPEAVDAARRAIALDPNSDGGYVALGSIQTAFTWEWQDAEQNLKRGLQLNSNNAIGHVWYAVLLESTRRPDQAIEQARLAVAAAPLSFFVVRMQGSILYYAHRYDAAMRPLERAAEMRPQHPNVVDGWMADVYEQRGMYDEAVTHDLLQLQQSHSPAQIAQLRWSYRRAGWRGYWQMQLQQMHPETQHGCRLYSAGLAYLRTGDRDHALDLLRRAAEQHCFYLGLVHTDPSLASLHGEPRFIQIEQLVDGASHDSAAKASPVSTPR